MDLVAQAIAAVMVALVALTAGFCLGRSVEKVKLVERCRGAEGKLIHVSGDIYAIAYHVPEHTKESNGEDQG